MDISAFDPNMQEDLRRLFPQEINEGEDTTVSYDIAEPDLHSHSTVEILVIILSAILLSVSTSKEVVLVK